jgi:hypothetical protein
MEKTIHSALGSIGAVVNKVRSGWGGRSQQKLTPVSREEQLDRFYKMDEADFNEIRALRGREGLDSYVRAMEKLSRGE